MGSHCALLSFVICPLSYPASILILISLSMPLWFAFRSRPLHTFLFCKSVYDPFHCYSFPFVPRLLFCYLFFICSVLLHVSLCSYSFSLVRRIVPSHSTVLLLVLRLLHAYLLQHCSVFHRSFLVVLLFPPSFSQSRSVGLDWLRRCGGVRCFELSKATYLRHTFNVFQDFASASSVRN